MFPTNQLGGRTAMKSKLFDHQEKGLEMLRDALRRRGWQRRG